MIQIRPSNERGCAEYGWLTTRHTFSFDQYHDPGWTGFRCLRVINEDVLAPGGAFPMHPHRDMEIITYVLEGALAHKDNLGNGSIIHPGDGQRMSAGTGVRHSEANPSPKEPAHLLQIWIEADRKGHDLNYQQKPFAESRRRERFCLIASPDGSDGSVTIHQDAKLYVTLLRGGQQLEYSIAQGRGAWIQIAQGAIELNQQALSQGDGAAITDEPKLKIKAVTESEILLLDLV
ncbi:MAG TPA: pirin family protein [Terriglobales bacterium]|nr:pirin family protein [Terriglobales bacterium]